MVQNSEKYRYVFQPAKIHESIHESKKNYKINIGVAKEQKHLMLKWASQSLDLTQIENLSRYLKIAEHKHHPTNLNKQIWP